MDRHFSLYLDLLRFCAAVLVVLAHYGQQRFFIPSGNHLYDFGREAVIVFFVLSGLVIAHTTAVKKASLKEYIAARCARMYVTVIPMLVLSFLLAALLPAQAGTAVAGAYQLAKLYIYIPLHLLFMGELWQLAEVPPFLAQYWSLSYEVWYYVLFGIVFYLRGALRTVLAAAVLLLIGPKLWLLLPVWLAGVWVYRHQQCLPVAPPVARAGCVATVALLVAWKWFALDIALRALGRELWPFPGFSLGSADRYLADYAVCLLVCLHFLCARQAQFSFPPAVAGVIRTLAGYSFTLYLVHGLVLGVWPRLFAHDPASALDIALLTICVAGATLVIGNVTEQRKPGLQRRLNVVFGTQRS
ncbi:acyltransferase [Massilia sp. PAMC28688]|uniref:acyltransferase family protein n=1 Tax=Massilia sp. PAMC28688 TaxID=2861283 RepID=UPI001C636499|nr:acyltransferase [Massilia sp. PAMC28688]QYF95086.1 acyltransferase [Massilia sp. PAMC28688]